VLNRDESIALLLKWRWSETDGSPVCPHCGTNHRLTYLKTPHPTWWCYNCMKQFSIFFGTVFFRSKMPLQIYATAIALARTQSIPNPHALSQILGTDYRTGILLCEKLERLGFSVRNIRKLKPPFNPSFLPWPEEKQFRFVTAWEAGASINELKATFGAGWQYWRKKLHLPNRQERLFAEKAARGGVRTPWIGQHAALRALWLELSEGTIENDELIQKIGRSWNSIRQTARRLGLPPLAVRCRDCGDILPVDRAKTNAYLCIKCRAEHDEKRLLRLRANHGARSLDQGSTYNDSPLGGRLMTPAQRAILEH
jgi:transposase-like protein